MGNFFSTSASNSCLKPVGNSTVGDKLLARMLMNPQLPTQPLSSQEPSLFEEWAIDLRRLKVGDPFAPLGNLYRGKYNGKDVAVKLLAGKEVAVTQFALEMAQRQEEQFPQELTLLATLKHPNIAGLVGACRKQPVLCIVTEYPKGGSVRQFLSELQHRPIPTALAVKQALDVARGMEYVHGLGIIHRYLKSDNLLICDDNSIKIAVFDVPRIARRTDEIRPDRWMAPEMMMNRPCTEKVDVYSFGIVLWELVTGLLPFPDMSALEIFYAVVRNGHRPDIPDIPILGDLMMRCWDANPDVRPSFSDVVRTLEEAQVEFGTTVRKARFRGCMDV